MSSNGYSDHDLTGQLEWWRNDDLISFVNDNTMMMSLEKHHIVRLAQELANRFEPFAHTEEDYLEEDDEDLTDELDPNSRNYRGGQEVNGG